MATITVTTSKVWDSEDYFYQHVGSDYAQLSIDEISDCLDDFLDFVGSKRGARAEWYYGCQCRGLYADAPEIDEDYMPDVDSYKWGVCYELDFMDAWKKHAKRISILHDALVKCNRMANKYWARRDTRWDDFTIWDARMENVRRMFYDEVEEALEDVCRAAERLMCAECDYWYSREAYEEWISENPEILDED